jgi:site-specific DNA recombinase
MWYYYISFISWVMQTTNPTNSGKEKSVKKLIKTVWRREDGIEICPESEEMAELVPMKFKKTAGKCNVMEPEAVSKTHNALLKAVVKAHLWKCQLEEGKHGSVREQ